MGRRRSLRLKESEDGHIKKCAREGNPFAWRSLGLASCGHPLQVHGYVNEARGWLCPNPPTEAERLAAISIFHADPMIGKHHYRECAAARDEEYAAWLKRCEELKK